MADSHSMGLLAHHVHTGTGKYLNMHYLPASIGSPGLLCMYIALQVTPLRTTASSEDFMIHANWKGRAEPYDGT